MTITMYKGDLPKNLDFGDSVAVDTETLGLIPERDPLCLIQLSSGDGTAHLLQFDRSNYDAPNLKKILSDPNCEKIFHFARFDVAVIKHYLDIDCAPIYCTKIASKLARTSTDSHSLKTLVLNYLSIEIPKFEQTSDWGTANLSSSQLEYAASDVLYLHQLKNILDKVLIREGRYKIAEDIFNFLPKLSMLDLQGWEVNSLLSH